MEKRAVFNNKLLPYLLVAPQLAVMLVFSFLPAGQTLWQAIHLAAPSGAASQFVGVQNFLELLHNPNYLNSLQITALFSTLVAVLGLGVSLLLAMLANRAIRTCALYRNLLIWPYAVAAAVSGALWLFLFSPSVGVLSAWLMEAGIAWNPQLRAGQAMLLVVVASVWKQVSYNFIFFLVGLQAIPRSLQEAAAVDGAGPGYRFRTIVLPLLAPTTLFLLVANLSYAFLDTFAVIDVLTQGGPGTSTSILVHQVYTTAFREQDVASSGAQSVILMLIVTLLTVVQFRYIDRKVNH